MRLQMMICPVCTIELILTERQSVEIDYCPECRGIWLDRGELEKLIERSTALPYYENEDYTDKHRRQEYRSDYHGGGYSEHHEQRQKGHHNDDRRRRSFLGDLFDF